MTTQTELLKAQVGATCDAIASAISALAALRAALGGAADEASVADAVTKLNTATESLRAALDQAPAEPSTPVEPS